MLLRLRLAAILLPLVINPSAVTGADDTPLPVGRTTQLFVDDHIIAQKTGLIRELGEVVKQGDGKPIFTDGWFYGTVLHDDQKFKMWFRKLESKGYAYGESADGLKFERKADLQGINFAGDYTLAVDIDPHAVDSSRRYKAAYDAPGMAAGLAYSGDGIRWTPYNSGQPVTHRAADSYNQILWDEAAGVYRLFTRTDFGTPGGSTEVRGTRSMTNANIESDPKNWKLVSEWIFDRDGKSEPKRRQVYAATCWIRYGVYFLLMSVYEYPGDLSEGRSPDLQTRHERDVMNFYIATSRDCQAWDLQWVYAGQPMIPRGANGTFDKDIILPASTIVTQNDRHWIYYGGANERHDIEGRKPAIGLATLGLDRFIRLAATDQPGTLVTRPFKVQGDRLEINLDARAGELVVEVQDQAGRPIPGFTTTDAIPGTSIDDLRWQPKWKLQSDIASLRDKVVRLRFLLRNAKLYSFKVDDSQATTR